MKKINTNVMRKVEKLEFELEVARKIYKETVKKESVKKANARRMQAKRIAEKALNKFMLLQETSMYNLCDRKAEKELNEAIKLYVKCMVMEIEAIDKSLKLKDTLVNMLIGGTATGTATILLTAYSILKYINLYCN